MIRGNNTLTPTRLLQTLTMSTSANDSYKTGTGHPWPAPEFTSDVLIGSVLIVWRGGGVLFCVFRFVFFLQMWYLYNYVQLSRLFLKQQTMSILKISITHVLTSRVFPNTSYCFYKIYNLLVVYVFDLYSALINSLTFSFLVHFHIHVLIYLLYISARLNNYCFRSIIGSLV